MNFDLEKEADPLIRCGVHGLWRYLKYEGKQTPSCSWNLGKTSIEITFASVDDLNALMAKMVGDFSNGFCVPPNYPSDRDDLGIYATILAHKAITQHFFAKKGAARSRSTGESDLVDSAEAPWSTQAKPQKLKLSFTRHRLHDDPPSLKVNSKGKLADAQELGIVYHPSTAKWNEVGQKAAPEVRFVLAFSCLSHVFLRDADNGEPFGLAIDADDFEQADVIHNAWIADPIYDAASEIACAWAIAAHLDLAPRSYVTVGAKTSSLLAITQDDRERLYPVVVAGMGAKEGVKQIRSLGRVDVKNSVDAFTKIIDNVRMRRAWYTGALPETPYPRTRNIFTSMFKTASTEMEKNAAAEMYRIRAALAAKYREHFNVDLKKSYEKADAFIVSVHLNRARNRPAVLAALAAITREAGRGFSAEVMHWMLEQTRQHYSEVQSLLILACTTFYTKTEAPVTGSSEDEITSIEDL